MNTPHIAVPQVELPEVAVPTSTGTVQRVLALDGVRGLAILLVMIFHFHTVPVTADLWGRYQGRFAAACGSGVTLFFVLSGFLITGILWNSKAEPCYLKNFYGRRLLRIFPLYYGVLFFALILAPILHAPSDPKYLTAVRHQVWLWTYLSNFYEAWTGSVIPLFGHFWSLAVEEHFYLLWPLAVLTLGRTALLWTCVGCFAVAFFARLIALQAGAGPEMMALRLTPCQIDGLTAGSFLALLLRPPQGLPSPALLAWGRRVFVGGGALLALLVFPLAELPGRSYPLLSGFYSLWVVFYGAGVLMAVLGSPLGWVRRFFEQRAFRLLGKYSYGIYVFHWPLSRAWLSALERWQAVHPVALLRQPWIFQGVFFLISGGSALLLAWCSWHLYEKHFLRLKHFFSAGGQPSVDHKNPL